MGHFDILRKMLSLFAVIFLSACASTGAVIETPRVNLTGVELTSANLQRQTFLLRFDVSNPNPFPLPVNAVEYRVDFDDEKFADGKTQGSFTVPARGDDSFAISVELDFLSSAKHLASLFQGGFGENISYELKGSLAVDIPFVHPLPFSSSGVIHMKQSAADEFD
jgi:LEA14-like dessication related protein